MKYPNKIFGNHPDVLIVGGNETQAFPLGQVMELPDGRLFRYALNGGAPTVANNLYQSEVPIAHYITQTATAASVDDTTVTFTPGATACAENAYAEGTIMAETATSLGHIYPVKSNTASAGSVAMVFTLADGTAVRVAITTSHKLTCIKNPYAAIIIHDSAPTAPPVGIPPVVVGLANYCWIQTHGICQILADSAGAWTAGQGLRASDEHDGSAEFLDSSETSADTGMIGWAPFAGVDTTFAPVFLTLE